MSYYAGRKYLPEALLKLLFTVIDKTPGGGATLDDLKDAYAEVAGKEPADRTIYRNVRRINELFDPAARGGKPGKGSKSGKAPSQGAIEAPFLIRSKRGPGGKMRYLYSGRTAVSGFESGQALTIFLGLYSQQKGLIKDHYKKVIGSILKEIMAKGAGGHSFFSGIEDHIHVSGQGLADPKMLLRRISEIIRAIENCKVIKIEYARTYDGALKDRDVEPYGLICRHGSWYLYGLCRWQNNKRIYRLDQIRRLKVVENSVFKRPPDMSVTRLFKDSWGTWNLADGKRAKAELIRLKVKKGVAERFKAVSFHDSQKVKPLEEGEAEVSFRIAGAGEMIPWLVSWGPTVEVLEPQWLKDELIQYLQDTASVYGV